MMEQTEVIIVGACPGGIKAALTASELGLEVTLIDSQLFVGGQYFKQVPEEFNIHDTSDHQKQTEKHLKREQNFAKMLGDIFALPRGLFSLAQPDTIICRCEQISLSEVKEAIAFGAQSVTDIKTITRSGMGNCQGRTCGSILSQILAREAMCDPADCQYLNIRPPIHPIPVEIIEEKTTEVLL